MPSDPHHVTIEIHDEVSRGHATAELDFRVDPGGGVGVAGHMRDAEGDTWDVTYRPVPGAADTAQAAAMAEDIARRALKERRDARGITED